MQYLLLIYEAETVAEGFSEAERGKMFSDYMTFTSELKDAERMVGGDALQPVSTATSVRVRDGERLVTDGPFAETKEQLGGYYLIEADNLDEAIQWAAKIPTAKTGTIEVRPIMVLNS